MTINKLADSTEVSTNNFYLFFKFDRWLEIEKFRISLPGASEAIGEPVNQCLCPMTGHSATIARNIPQKEVESVALVLKMLSRICIHKCHNYVLIIAFSLRNGHNLYASCRTM